MPDGRHGLVRILTTDVPAYCAKNKVQTTISVKKGRFMSETYITIYSGYVYLSSGTELYLKTRFDILEWGDSFALVPSDSGWYKIRSTKIGRFAC